MTIEKQLELITPKILPPGFSFLDQQKAAIFADKPANIVAGPGSGKTTVLTTKCALLLKDTSLGNQGICLITHTNVAVDEIKQALNRIGIKNVEYPHFVGTIQEFFNTFFGKKAFHQIIKGKQFRVLDDDEYQEKFVELFEQYKPSFYTYPNYPNASKASPKLIIDDNGVCEITSNANTSYKKEFEKCIRILFQNGLLNNKQCLELANWHFTKHEELLKNALSARFKYVLLDEAQDTSMYQYDMLTRLMNNNNNLIFQKFGDPYQALYNIFEGNHDAWVPRDESDYDYEEISETTRFGTSIANIVKKVCIEQYDTFKSTDTTDSFNPYYIIYENEKDLVEQYQGLIVSCNEKSHIFSSSKKKDAIVAAHHDDLVQLFSSYTKPTSKIKKNESRTRRILNFIVGLLSKEMKIPFVELKESVIASPVCKIKLSLCVKEMVSNNTQTELFIKTLKEILSILTSNEKSDFSVVNVIKQVEYFKQELITDHSSDVQVEANNFHIGTIHSVKGETHRSTLLILSSIFREYVEGFPIEYPMFDLLKEYFTGEYIEPKTITNISLRNETIKSLKLAYVAMSRPSHLMAIAIPRHFVKANKEIFSRMDNFGWKKYNQDVLISVLS